MSDAAVLAVILQRESARAEGAFESYRTRALAVLSVSTGAATLLSGALAVGIRKPGAKVENGALILGSISIGLLVLSMVLAIAIHWPRGVVALDAGMLAKTELPSDADWEPASIKFELVYLASLQKANSTLERLFAWSLVLQLLAVGAAGALLGQLMT